MITVSIFSIFHFLGV